MYMEATEKLVDVLLKNGFWDSTEKGYPEHFLSRQSGKAQVPNVKVKLSYGKRGSFEKCITLDYIRIRVSTNSPGKTEEFYKMDPQLLRNILTWFSMPESFRREFDHYKIAELHTKIEEYRSVGYKLSAKIKNLILTYDLKNPYWVE